MPAAQVRVLPVPHPAPAPTTVSQVTWTWQGGPYDVARAVKPGDCDHGITAISPSTVNGSFAVTFDRPGDYRFVCSLGAMCDMGMQVTVLVS